MNPGTEANTNRGRHRMIRQGVRSIARHSALVGAVALLLGGCVGSPSGVALGPSAVAGKTPDGTVDMEEVQAAYIGSRSEEHTSELQSLRHLVCRLLLEKKKQTKTAETATT